MIEPDDSLAYRVSRSIFLSPHNDDETLFGAFTLQNHRPRVIVVLRSFVQEKRNGIRFEEREAETTAACYALGVPYEQWTFRDDDPDWTTIAERLGRVANTYDSCFAPAVEDGGHEHHSRLGDLAVRVWGRKNVTSYLTYRRGEGKSSSACEVQPATPEHLAAKLMALSCYRTQMRPDTGCQPWFLGDLREFVEC